jgi:ribonuclease P protein component
MQLTDNLLIESKKKERFSFKYFERLHERKDFDRVFKSGLKIENENVKILGYIRGDCCVRRLGIITSKKIGTAVVRNKIKRRLREIFRTSKYSLKPNLDLIFVPKQGVVLLNYVGLKKTVLDLIKRAGLSSNSK